MIQYYCKYIYFCMVLFFHCFCRCTL